ncbi:MAG: flagellar hook-associated protein FlgK [Sedimentisphaerales bacterium]|nr:flagellar hook-associated protein FlgK [Sedimentisphaerales bacterium]
MQSFNIGLTGLKAASKALDTIGNNIANAATEGYHRQRVELVPADPVFDGKHSWGTGVDILAITRAVNAFIERQQLVQKGIVGQTEQELSVLRSLESAIGEFSTTGSLSQAIDEFFNALRDLAAHPAELIYQRQFITAANSLSGYFQHMGSTISRMNEEVARFVDDTVQTINGLTESIAELNKRIQEIEVSGTTAHNLRDQRDRLLSDLAGLVAIDTNPREYGVVDVTIAGMPVVTGSDCVMLEYGYTQDQELGICPEGSGIYKQIEGGRLGGLLSAYNQILKDIGHQFDDLAQAIITNINRYHAQGIGTSGSFSELTGWVVNPDTPLGQLDQEITPGTLYIRLINTETGEIRRVQIDIDPSTDTVRTLAEKIAAVDGLDASVLASRLHIEAEAGYQFDFLPAPLPQPDQMNIQDASAAPTISVEGIYTGDVNDILTFTVQSGGMVGNGNWSIIVTNQAGQTVSILDLGRGYVAGTALDLGCGIRIRLGVGSLSDGDSFSVQVLANSDTSNILAATGMNAFFSGTDAISMAVLPQFEQDPSLLATCLGPDHTDNANASRMASLQERLLDALNGQTIGNYYAQLVTRLGQDISTRQLRQDNTEAMLQNLATMWNQTSGVDVNEEAAQILIFQQMYNGLAKYMMVVQRSVDTLMDLL